MHVLTWLFLSCLNVARMALIVGLSLDFRWKAMNIVSRLHKVVQNARACLPLPQEIMCVCVCVCVCIERERGFAMMMKT